MKTAWTAHLKDKDEQERFKNSLLGSKFLFERQMEIVDARLRAIDQIETSAEIYKQPGWEGILAHYSGEKASLKWVKELISLDNRSTDG